MKKYLIFVTVWLGLSFGLIFNAHAGGRINLMLSGAPLIDSFQSVEYKDNAGESDGKSGYGIIFDYIFPGGHAIAVDYYSFTEKFIELSDLYDATDEVLGLFLGYRHHFPFGFYLGGGVTLLDFTSTVHDIPSLVDEDDNIISTDDLISEFEQASPITLTLGYQHSFSSRFFIGSAFTQYIANDLET